MQLIVEFLDFLFIKLSTIVSNNGVGKSKLADDWLPEEYLDSTLSDTCQEFCLYLLGKVVDGDK